MNKEMRLCLAFAFFCCFSFHGFAADHSDTLYYDRYWNVIEQPFATYYRVCTLSKADEIHFTGSFRDYTIDHTLLAEGSYDSTGRKQGLFTYYYTNGKTRKLGHFVNNEMSGQWYFYRPDGVLYYINNHYNSHEAAPLFIVRGSELVLKDGSGSFSINTGDFPDVFNGEHLLIKGHCANNMKSGNWEYYSKSNSGAGTRRNPVVEREYYFPEHRNSNVNYMGAVDREDKIIRGRDFYSLLPDEPASAGRRPRALPLSIATEIYENGLFLRGLGPAMTPDMPFTGLTYVPQETVKAEEFYPHPVVFGNPESTENQQRFKNFLVSGTAPEIRIQSTAYNNNLQGLLSLFQWALSGTITPYLQKYDPENLRTEVPLYLWREEDLRFRARFSIQPNGTLSNISITGTLPERDRERILYILTRIKGLVPPSNRSITNLYVYTVTKKSGGGQKKEYYLSYNDHSQSH